MKRKIVIVGGGNAGWMTATHLLKTLPHLVDITLIESDKISVIGVGESCPPHLTSWLADDMEFDIYEFMRETGSIQKLGNRFEGWAGPDTYENFTFTWSQPEETLYQSPDMITMRENLTNWQVKKGKVTDHLAKLFKDGEFKRFDEMFGTQHYFMEKVKSPFIERMPLLKTPGAYAHHADAELVGNYIKKKVLEQNSIEYKISTVRHVDVDENKEFVKSITLESGETIEADLFIDCTGFSALLIGKLNDNKKLYKDNPIDRALVCQYNYNDKNSEMKNYTQSIARKYGWQFVITLWERFGTGYCYSSKHISDEDALKDFKETMKEHEQLKEIKLIKWEPFSYEQIGKGNVVGIGLSGGFIEPMEANMFAIIINGLRLLDETLDKAYHFDSADIPDWTVFNDKMNKFYQGISEFILYHYTIGDTLPFDTDFWKDMKRLGKTEDHESRCVDAYFNPDRGLKGVLTRENFYPDSMYLEMAAGWNCNLEPYAVEQSPLTQLAKISFESRRQKNEIISDLVMDYIPWHEKYVLNG